ncbi:hypothetical protein PQX77_018706 [Marasmius sp. AFHP31]|nr:hypothetical protein PQX77_018706 [Marasmius sp. AFHP31]
MLALGIIQNGFAITLALFSGIEAQDSVGEDLNMRNIASFSAALAPFALLCWIWMSVLIAFNNKVGVNHVLTTATPHLISVGIMAVLWLAFGIMTLSTTKDVCTADVQSWYPEICVMTITTGTLTMVLWALATGATFSVYWTIRKSGDRWCKVYAQDGQLPVDERVYGPMPRATALRTTIYSVVLFITICETVVAGITSFVGGFLSVNFPIFSWVTSGVSLLTWIWAAVLLSYNRRPSSKRGITRAAAHFYSISVLSIVWLAVGILWSTETHEQCTALSAQIARLAPPGVRFNVFENVRCSVSVANLVVAFLVFLLTVGVAYYIFRTTRNGGGTMGGSNVAQFDGDLVEVTEQSQMVAAPGAEAGSQTGVAV